MSNSGMTHRAVLLTATALACYLGAARPAFAQAAATDAKQALAASTTSDDAATPKRGGNQEDIVVTGSRRVGGGLMKAQTAAEAMSSITPAAIQEKLPAASPLQIATTLPGANFGSSDAFGLSIRNFLSVRGLDQTEIGFLIDNAPGGDIVTYFPYAETWADNENISDITLTPGNSRLQDPILNASGGEFIESIRSPRDKFGGMVSGSVGSFHAWRTFADIDTGYLGNTGVKTFLSYSHTSNQNYVGPGTNKRDHIDFRAEKEWSDKAKSTLFVSYNYLNNARIPILTLAQAQDGINNDRLDTYAYTSTYTPAVNTNYYKNNRIFNRDILVSSNNDFQLGDNVTLHVTPYYKYKLSISSGQTKLSPTSVFNGNTLVTPAFDPGYLQGGALFAASDLRYQTNAAGVSSYVEANISPSNTLSAGYWFQYAHINYGTWLNLLDNNGNPRSYYPTTALRTTSGALITGTLDTITTTTNQVFIGDTQRLFDDKLSITLGFKELFYHARVDNQVIGAAGVTSKSWSRPMPRLLLSYKVDDRNQIYANVTTNARMPNAQTTYVTSFNVASGGFLSVGNTDIKPEYTISSQIGYRYNGPLVVDVSAFYMKLKNHQVQGLQFINGVTQNTSIEAGGETIKGVSGEVSTRSYHGFSFYGNAQYLDGKFDDNVPLRGDFLATKGKQMVDSPKWIANAGARFESGGFYASVAYKYVGPQFSTFVNDQTMPSYHTWDLSVGYKLPDIGALSKPTVRLSVTNLGDKSYIGSVASTATNAIATRGINGTVMPAGTPIYYISAPLAVMATISTEF